MRKLSVLEKHGFNGLNRWPGNTQLESAEAVSDYFMHGYAPPEPLITKNTKITAFGSCFAGNVSRYLLKKGYQVNAHSWDHNQSDLIRIDEIMVHTPALLAQFEWAFNNKPLGSVFIGSAEEKAQTYHSLEACKQIIKETDFFIITLGLTEAWYDKESEQYLWKFVPNRRLYPTRFESRFVSFSENLENLRRIYNLIKSNVPCAKVLFTLSPIPLLGSYHGKSVVAANTASKATLRAVLHEFLSQKEHADALYFPSYELVNDYIESPWKEDNRHITPDTVETIMSIFDEYYLSAND
ncbi:GSCFA domain-containing protein [Alteromonas sp. R78001]|uniref:GSCFA domain-containing protein n=1 Tax=Alteromonas sp. R78001 TaxID=3093865 RepID=UPI003670A090